MTTPTQELIIKCGRAIEFNRPIDHVTARQVVDKLCPDEVPVTDEVLARGVYLRRTGVVPKIYRDVLVLHWAVTRGDPRRELVTALGRYLRQRFTRRQVGEEWTWDRLITD